MIDLPALTPDQFDDFLQEAHGRPTAPPTERLRAFPWQRDLLAQAIDGAWPGAVDVPTGLGKTSLVDIAVFAVALQAGRPASERSARTRTYMLVDRRLVVDQTFTHARAVADALEAAVPGSVCAAVAARLLWYTASPAEARDPLDDGLVPLSVTRMRGGVTWDARWLARPDQPAVVVGTVDQLCSRVLFRGYGVSDASLPIDAALVGTDALIVLDEAHLSEPARQTLSAVVAHDGAASEHPLPGRRPRLVEMSATLRAEPGRLGFDVDAHLAVPEAARRLASSKPTALWEVTDTPAKPVAALDHMGTALAAAARTAVNGVASRDGEPLVVAVVANTVRSARAAHSVLASGGASAILLTGRSREVDRAWVTAEVLERAGADRPAAPPGDAGGEPFFLVATQTIEVGVDIDADILVTEAAPLDALAQRLGRVDRRGRRTAAGIPGASVVLHASRLHADDLVYGSPNRDASPTAVAWSALCAAAGASPEEVRLRRLPAQVTPTGGLDLGPLGIRSFIAGLDDPEAAFAPRPDAPTLTTEHTRAWARTAPKPRADLDIAPFLHGRRDPETPVRILWRADVTPAGAGELDRRQLVKQVEQSLRALPPHDSEIVEVTLAEARRWLRRSGQSLLTDTNAPITDPAAKEDDGPAATSRSVAAVTQSGGALKASVLADARDLRPWHLLVASTAEGGLDRYGWAPAATAPVLDVADLCERRRPLLRLSPAVAIQFRPSHTSSAEATRTGDINVAVAHLSQVARDNSQPAAIAQAISQALDTYERLLADTSEALKPAADSMCRRINQVRRRPVAVRRSLGPWTVASGHSHHSPRRGGTKAMRAGASPAAVTRDDADDTTSSTTADAQVPTLDDHLDHVGRRAHAFALGLGIAGPAAGAVALAAGAHDLGKLDPRFQRMLQGGDDPWFTGGPPVAKSRMARDQWRDAASAAGWPAGLRHEALSVALIDTWVATSAGQDRVRGLDPDLVLHLVGTHHGYGRPLFPPVVAAGVAIKGQYRGTAIELADSDATDAIQDWDGPARLVRLLDRYSPWGLALLEAVVRLADMNCSEAGL